MYEEDLVLDLAYSAYPMLEKNVDINVESPRKGGGRISGNSCLDFTRQTITRPSSVFKTTTHEKPRGMRYWLASLRVSRCKHRTAFSKLYSTTTSVESVTVPCQSNGSITIEYTSRPANNTGLLTRLQHSSSCGGATREKRLYQCTYLSATGTT